jgi:small-conductance mechanosensitive channel
VYKRLRFFRASVGNASVIDKVLEGIIDSVFNFVLALVVLSMLQFNPWPLLVSISTLLVSLAFAVGPSTARYIEGVLLIALRRPYDLGDRILIVHAETGENQGVNFSWFVEDINLFSTTLRFAATNEVATVNNGAIALARIVNYARSPLALVTVNVRFMLDKTDDAVVSVFRAGLESFIKDRPRQWDGMNYFRCETIDTDTNMLEYSLRLRNVKTWQDSPGILNDKAEISRFCMQLGKQLGINFVSPNKRLRLYTSNIGGLNIFNDTQESEADSKKAMNLAGINTSDE